MGKYYANFNANNGTRLMSPAEYTSRKEAIASIRRWAVDETFAGSSFTWSVSDENDKEIAAGGGTKSREGRVNYYRTL